MIVKIHRKIKTFLQDGKEVVLQLPRTSTSEAAAVDLQSVEDFVIEPGARAVIETGLIVRAPRNHCMLVMSRSGLAAKHGVFVLNSPGLIDRDYCGPNDTIKVILQNSGTGQFVVQAGDRIAQLKLDPFDIIEWDEQESANFAGQASRGGLGSTGTRTLGERLEEGLAQPARANV